MELHNSWCMKPDICGSICWIQPTCSTICLVCSSMGHLRRKCRAQPPWLRPFSCFASFESALVVVVPELHLLYMPERKCSCSCWKQLICSSACLACSKLGIELGMCIQQAARVGLVEVVEVVELVWLVVVPEQEVRLVEWGQELGLTLPAAHLHKEWRLFGTMRFCKSLGKMPARVLCTELAYRTGRCSTCMMGIPHYCNQRH